MQTICDAGCKQQFDLHDYQHSSLDGGVEKTFFTCPHCQHEYVAFYTDEEIRKLQESVQAFNRSNGKQNAIVTLMQKIKQKMDGLRLQIEADG